MLCITIEHDEEWDEVKEEFTKPVKTTIKMEHSLVSMYKWEQKWKIPFLKKNRELTREQALDYYRCMTITQNVDPDAYRWLTKSQIKEIEDYINTPQTATVIRHKEGHKPGPKDDMTSELLYYYMYKLGIGESWEKKHLTCLITLIEVFGIKDQPPKKLSRSDAIARNAKINAAQRKMFGGG